MTIMKSLFIALSASGVFFTSTEACVSDLSFYNFRSKAPFYSGYAEISSECSVMFL
jgi:hypothetical protein